MKIVPVLVSVLLVSVVLAVLGFRTLGPRGWAIRGLAWVQGHAETIDRAEQRELFR